MSSILRYVQQQNSQPYKFTLTNTYYRTNQTNVCTIVEAIG
jgi:hypothetical protein